MNQRAPIAQLDRAVDYESTGREFESLWAHHKALKKNKFVSLSKNPQIHGGTLDGTWFFKAVEWQYGGT